MIFNFCSCKKKLEEEVASGEYVVRGGYALGCGTLNLAGTATTLVSSGLSGAQGVTTDGTYLYVIGGANLYKIE